MRRSRLLHTLLLAGTAWLASGAFTPALAQDAEDAKRGVARISLINGDVSVRRGDSGDWVAAAVNAPVMAQDRITTGPTSRTEVQFDWANMLRIGSNAELEVAQLEYRRYVVQLARGTVTFRVLRDSDADVSLDTPSISVRPTRRGVYRVTVREDGTTEVAVRAGDVDVFTPRGSQRLTAGQSMEARGTQSDPEFQIAGATPIDEWDRWNETRDRALEGSQAYKYVSRDVYGAEDLDPYGTWEYDAAYGNVWRPTVVAGWAPYRHGRWSWVDWYGWTWVSYDPWGWAPYHYGRWYHGARGWCWYPGGIGVRHHWSPALVAFFGFGRGVSVGVGFGGGWGNVGWVPLAPHERFSPWWGRGYYGGYRNSAYMNRGVNITNVNITNVYRNARMGHGVTAVNAGDFSHGRFNNHVRVDNSHLSQASLSRGVMPAVPGDAHLRYSDRRVGNVSSRMENTRFFSNRQVTPVQRVSFNDQRQSLQQVSRVPVSERNAASNMPAVRSESARGRQDGGVTSTDGRGWRRAGETPSASRPSNAGQPSAGRSAENRGGASGGSENRSWRRFEQGGTGSNAPAARASEAPRTSQASPSRGSEQGNWRRFGDSGSRQPSVSGQPSGGRVTERQSGPSSSGAQPSATGRSEQRGGWQRFGEPGSGSGSSRQASPQAAPRSERPQTQERQNYQAPQSRSWNRFGSPGSTSGSTSGSRPSYSAPSQQYERRSVTPQSTPQSAPRYSAPSRQESLRVAPPVVRERSSSPRAERPSYSAPSQSGSRYSAPSSSGRSYSAPSSSGRSYSAPSSSGRSYSAPSSSGRSSGSSSSGGSRGSASRGGHSGGRGR